jgi:hypothetical protein
MNHYEEQMKMEEQDYAPLTLAQELYWSDYNRLAGKRHELLQLLFDGKWHKNSECAAIQLSFNDTFFALRKDGWIIESRRVKGGKWEFRLLGKGEPPTTHKPMSRPQHLVAAHILYTLEKADGPYAMERVRKRLPEWMQCEPKKWTPDD